MAKVLCTNWQINAKCKKRIWLENQQYTRACEPKRMINCELKYERIHPWNPGAELIIQATDKFVCAGILCLACCWMCHLKGWEAAEAICNTWRCRGLLVYFIPDRWCRHNHGLARPPELYGLYVKGRNTCTD